MKSEKIIDYLKLKVTDVDLRYYKPRQPMITFHNSYVKHISIKIDDEWFLLDNYVKDRFGNYDGHVTEYFLTLYKENRLIIL